MRPQLEIARAETLRWLGDWHPLVRQIAPGESVPHPPTASALRASPALATTAALKAFLLDYKVSVLLPFELPAVKQACELALRHEVKELLELDRACAGQCWLQAFELGSRAAGRSHLERLQPLRDQRGIRRYLAAIGAGEAHGWHFLVAGVALALYAVPLRQGMMDYAGHTFWSALGQTAGPLGMSAGEATALVRELAADLPSRMQTWFPAGPLTAV